jgi:hypothetical protein
MAVHVGTVREKMVSPVGLKNYARAKIIFGASFLFFAMNRLIIHNFKWQ